MGAGVRSSKAVLLVAFLVLMTLAVYAPVRDHQYVNFDDSLYAADNLQVRSGLTVEGFRWAFTTMEAANWHPLTWLSLMLDAELFGNGPRGHHLVNLALHMVCVILLLILLRGMTGDLGAAAFAAALFAVHPLHVESVAWVAERKDVLSTGGGLLALMAYLGYVRRPGAGRYLLLVVCYALSLLAKPMLVTLPFLLLLLDWWPLGRLNLRGLPGNAAGARVIAPAGILREKLPLLMLAAASSVVTYVAQARGGSVSLSGMLPLGTRLANALASGAKYLGLTVWPAGLAVIYPHPGPRLPFWQAAAGGTILLLATALALGTARRRPYLLMGWLWYLGTLMPVIGLVQVGPQAMADRYTYVPLIGIFIMAAWGIAGMAEGHEWPRFLLPTAAVAVVVALAVAARVQVGYWKDGVTLFTRAVRVTTGNVLAHNNLGNALMARGDLQGAAEQFRRVLHFDPSNAGIHYNLGLALYRQGYQEEAMEHYRSALQYRPGMKEARNNLGIAYAEAGDYAAAVKLYRETLESNPRDADAHYNLGMTLEKLGRADEAAGHYQAALVVKPGDADARNNLGAILLQQGRLTEAFEQFGEALRLRPAFAEAHNNMGRNLALLGRVEEARGHFAEAVRLDPGNVGARRNLERAEAMRGGAPGGPAR